MSSVSRRRAALVFIGGPVSPPFYSDASAPPRRRTGTWLFVPLLQGRLNRELVLLGVVLRVSQNLKVLANAVRGQRDGEVSAFGLHVDIDPRVGQPVRVV